MNSNKAISRSDEQSHFRAVVEKYQRRVYGIVRKMVIDHDDADDIVQEVFIKVWNNRNKFEGKSEIFTWIYRIAVNESLQFLRKQKKRSLFSFGLDHHLVGKLDSSMGPDADEIERSLQKALLSLPDKQRAVFHMRYYDELTYEQMAEVLGGSVGSLKASYHHASKKVEKYLTSSLNQIQ